MTLVMAAIVELETGKDPVLSRVLRYTICRWPPKIDVRSKEFHVQRHNLSESHKCLLFGSRVVIPPTLQAKVLAMLHDGHPGIVRTKLLAHEIVWWPTLTRDIEQLCVGCEPCKLVNFTSSAKETLPWPTAKVPFERVHLDFFVFESQSLLIMCDSYSKWIFVEIMPSTTTLQVNLVLLRNFAVWGMFQNIACDNGPPFQSEEFLKFCLAHNVNVIHYPPGHPNSSAYAERGVQTIKKCLKKMLLDKRTKSLSLPER